MVNLNELDGRLAEVEDALVQLRADLQETLAALGLHAPGVPRKRVHPYRRVQPKEVAQVERMVAEGKGASKIAKELGRPLGTIKRLLQKAKGVKQGAA